jgi:hypothetical protein
MPIRGGFLEAIDGPAPKGWDRGSVTLKFENPDALIPIEAWRRGAFALHKMEDGGVNITHAPTGMYIWRADTMDQAVEFVDAIEPLHDWSSILKKMPAGSELWPKVRAVIHRFYESVE